MQRLRTFLKSERGNALAMGAAAMPMLLASAGFAIDTIQFSVMKRQMQRAADSGALAGAYALSQVQGAANETTFAEDAVNRDITKNSKPTLVGNPSVSTGASMGYSKTVQVSLTARPRMPFMAIFTKSTSEVTATATAALVDGGTFCVLSLYNGTDTGIDVTGSAILNLGCGVATNARGANAVTADGSSLVTASPIMSVGGLSGSTNYAGTTKLQPYSAEQADPYAGIGVPSYDPSACQPEVVVQNNDPVRDLTPGCYLGLDIKGTLNLAAGEYIIHGGNIDFDAGSTVTGTGVTFIMTGTNGAAGTFDTDGHPKLTLTAPTTGTYRGILFYRDRRAAPTTIVLNGSSTSNLLGALYFPTANIEVKGNAGFTARCFQLVGLQLKFSGNSAITNTCPELGNNPTFKLQYVRLVK